MNTRTTVPLQLYYNFLLRYYYILLTKSKGRQKKKKKALGKPLRVVAST